MPTLERANVTKGRNERAAVVVALNSHRRLGICDSIHNSNYESTRLELLLASFSRNLRSLIENTWSVSGKKWLYTRIWSHLIKGKEYLFYRVQGARNSERTPISRMRHRLLPFFDLAASQGSFLLCALLLGIDFEPAGAPLIFAVIMGVSAYLFGMYNITVRYAGVSLMYSASLGAMIGLMVVSTVYGIEMLGYLAFSSLLTLCCVVGTRVVIREYLFKSRHHNASNTLVYGAGEAGVQFLSAAMQGNEFKVINFLDDDKKRTGSSIHGIHVIGSSRLSQTIKSKRIETIVLALPSLTHRERKSIIEGLIQFPVRLVTIPTSHEITNGISKVSDTQDVPVEDLLGRDPVAPDDKLLRLKTQGRTVLVTGAGGSIGSELCRQVAALKPSILILLDNSEPAIYAIQQELRRDYDISIQVVLGSVCDEQVLSTLFQAHKIETIFHAAAYKHVPMLEENPLAALINNAYGTELLLQNAVKGGADSFTLISTDKAVRPTNIMGATKRLSEMLCQAKAQAGGKTKISMVRFGNVLGSSGSVIPTFRAQIAAGGPVTVTHRDITRFFMTIPEAAQLVIQSAALAQGGEVFLLDMGEPIRIYDLAERLIRLSGKKVARVGEPEKKGSIRIEITGLRPGEKLFEELLIDTPHQTTENCKILIGLEPHAPYASLRVSIDRIKAALEDNNLAEAKALLIEAGTGYQEFK